MRKTLTFTDKRELRSGTSASGRDWTLWSLSAQSPDGLPVHEALKAFDSVPLGTPVEVELEPDEREQGCYLVRLAKPAAGGGKAADRLEALEAKQDWLVGKVLELETALGGGTPAPRVSPAQGTLGDDADEAPARHEDDLEDIPF